MTRRWKYLRPLILLLVSILLFVFSDTSLWVGSLLLTVFIFAVDVWNIDQRDSSNDTTELPDHNPGVLGRYVLDDTPSYGLFINLLGDPVFVAVKEDRLVNEREDFARFLADNTDKLESSLNAFLASNPNFADRQLSEIGLHSKVLDQGEVFWEPDGYTLLNGLEFSLGEKR